MKKNILFIMNNLTCGGAEKSLISLLQAIDYSQFNVDLLLFKQEGIFLSKVPEQVRLLTEPQEYKYFDMPIKKAIKENIMKSRISIVFYRILAGYIFYTEKNSARCEQRVWKYLGKTLSKLDKKYDVAIGYLEKNPIYYAIEKVNAKKKIGFIHTDYDKFGMDSVIDMYQFNYLDKIVTISEECANVLKNRFPMYKEKVQVMNNIISSRMIYKLAQDKVEMKKSNKTIVSIGRLSSEKGFDMAIGACRVLINKGYKIHWNIIGEGEERQKIEELIHRYNLEDNVSLLGIKENPYPYIQQADIYVQPSRFEGKSIAIDEAKILQKPIIVTNFSTVKDQIVHMHNGLIVDMNEESISEGIEKLVNNNEMCKMFSANLADENLDTESEINKLYQLL